MNIRKKTFRPKIGKVVELPAEIKRKDAYRYGGGGGANGQLGVTVIGTGDTTEWVVLKMDDDEATIPKGAEILGADVWQNTVYYLVEKSAYGSGN